MADMLPVHAVLKRFEQPDEVRDSWVLGHERYVSLHFLGAGEYAAKHNHD